MRSNQLSSSPGLSDLSLHTAFQPPPHDRACSDCSTVSPLSSTQTSPTSSPTSPFNFNFRRFHRGSSARPLDSNASDHPSSRSQSPFRLSAALRRPSSLVLLRRQPSKVDTALSEERSRCDEDAIERQGLELMEPRPVDPIGIPMDLNANVFSSVVGDRSSARSNQSRVSQPRFVMGGIFEVMEGRA